ncbi:MAG: DUF368 domain-containing protein [Oscillospiraceae bacterium]
MNKLKTYLRYFLSGLAFGVANVIPGVSGGTMLVVFGIYDALTEAISGIKAIFRNFLFLLTFALGAGSGIVLCAFAIKSLFEAFGLQTNMFFIGLILGSVPLIIRTGTAEQKPRALCLVPLLAAFAAVVALTALERMEIIGGSVGTDSGVLMALWYFLSAVICAVTMIIPGVSGSFVMMLLGVYDNVLTAITTLDFAVLVPFAAGAVVGIIGGAKLISVLIKKHKLMVYSAILGLVIGSVYAIIPEDFGFTTATGWGFVCLVFGVLAAQAADRLGAKD